MKTTVTRTNAGYHGAITINGRIVALMLPARDRNAAIRAALTLARRI